MVWTLTVIAITFIVIFILKQNQERKKYQNPLFLSNLQEIKHLSAKADRFDFD